MNAQAIASHTHYDAATAACIAACERCHRSCLAEIAHCLQMGGEHAEAAHIGLMRDCAQVCATAADLMSTNSQFHQEQCAVCAQICTACAQQCEMLGGMEDCARACRDCAQACDQMSTVAVGEDA